MKYFLYAACIFSLILTGCSTASPSLNLTPDTLTLETVTPNTSTLSTPDTSPPATSTPNPNFSPTPDLRLDPAKWQEWPVIPTVSARAREIYQKGLALGNDPNAFSKIGDCQSVPASFLGIYETDRYSFAPEHQQLQETVDFYNGSFAREGESVRGGFNTSSVLLPFWANAEVCQPGENPMACENRIHNPSVVFISLEVWFEGRTPDVYEKYLRQIIEFNIQQGTLPILATKADNVEGDHSINRTIAKLAHEYDLPLWNYWRAVQPLPNHGLDPTDMTGFHLNVDGWNMRSFSALQVLDAVHRATMNLTADGTAPATPTSTPASLASFTPGPRAGLPFSSVIPVSADSAPASLLFGFSTRAGETLTSAGIFQSNLNGRDFLALADSGFTLLDHSASGLLAAQGQNLYLIKDSQPTLLADKLFSDAIFLADGRVAAILQSESGNQLAIFAEGAPQIIATESAPQTLHPSRDPNHLYWSAGDQTFVTALSDLTSAALAYTGAPAFASDGKMVFMSRDAEGKNRLTLVNGDATQTLPLFGNRLVDMQWSPDGSTLAVSVANVSDYSGLTLASKLYFVTWPASLDKVLEMTDEAAIERHVWSPDGKSLLLVTRKVTGAQVQFNFAVLDTSTQTQIPALGFDWTSEEYLLLQSVFWIP